MGWGPNRGPMSGVGGDGPSLEIGYVTQTGTPRSRPRWRLSAASVVVAACSISAFLLVREGLERSVSFCALGGCGHAENTGHGWAMLIAGLANAVLGIVVSVRLGDAGLRLLRAVVVLPAVAAIGLASLAVSLPDVGGWGENASIMLLVVGAVGVLVPPNSLWWYAGAAFGIGVASALSESVWTGVVIGTATFLTSVVIIEWSQSRS
jgi:hypothetical protein